MGRPISSKFELLVIDQRPTIRGECDAATARNIEGWLDGLDAEPLEVDLSGVTFFDSSALRAFLNMRRCNRHLRLVNPSKTVRSVLEITGTTEYLVHGGHLLVIGEGAIVPFSELRAVAPARSAARSEGIAEFHSAVSQVIDGLGDDARARCARIVAELQRKETIRERHYAAQPSGCLDVAPSAKMHSIATSQRLGEPSRDRSANGRRGWVSLVMSLFGRWLLGPPPGEVGTEPDARFSYANERTFLAWNRTALALISVGLAVTQLLPPFRVTFGRRIIGLPLIVLGAVVAIASLREWAANERAMRLDRPLPRSRLPQIVAITIAAIAMAALVLAVVGPET